MFARRGGSGLIIMSRRVWSKGFDENMPITRMLPGSSPCELRLLLPDTNIGKDGFHGVVVENLIGSLTWRSRHVSPSDVIALRQRWPRAVFQVMKERSAELADLRRQAYTGLQWAYRYAYPGYCPECKTRTDGSLESSGVQCGKVSSENAEIILMINTVVR